MDHANAATELVSKTRANGGLAPVDLESFWVEDDAAHADPFGATIPQVPLGIRMGMECVFAELGVPEDWHRLEHDEAWRAELATAYNDRAEQIVGRRLLNEVVTAPDHRYPAHKELHDVFEAKRVWNNESYWLQRAAHGEDQLKALLDRVEERLDRLRDFLLPPNWAEEKTRLTALGVKPSLYRSQRGPVTFACSLYGAEEFILLLYDNPALAARLRDTILRAMLGIARVLDEEAGYTAETAPHGFGFLDDNCCLLTPELYEFFGYPILKGIFDRYSPNPQDSRYQHSDSAMGHVLPILRRLDLTGVNFGPTLTVREIREHLPRAVIYGQLAPFTFSRNKEQNIVMEFLRDFEQARERRGLVFAAAGSINNGSRLTGMRLIMSAIQHYGRYDA